MVKSKAVHRSASEAAAGSTRDADEPSDAKRRQAENKISGQAKAKPRLTQMDKRHFLENFVGKFPDLKHYPAPEGKRMLTDEQRRRLIEAMVIKLP